MARIIMTIPNQHFSFMADWDIDDDNIYIDFSKEYTGTIYLVTECVEGDEDAMMPFGVPNGENEGKLAFWQHTEMFRKLWEKMVKAKQKYSKED
jgi:hypothetical protein